MISRDNACKHRVKCSIILSYIGYRFGRIIFGTLHVKIALTKNIILTFGQYLTGTSRAIGLQILESSMVIYA